MNEAGLRTVGGEAIPLRGVEVEGEVIGGHARMRVRQRYRNGEERPVEAVYTFPLPSEATLTGFAMTCDGRRIEGVVREREEAFQAYDEAITSGHGAALLDQERPNVFTASVGNLLPGEETLVELEYVQRVRAEEGALRLAIPTLVAPRYIPGEPRGDRTAHGVVDPTDRVPDADRITPPIGPATYGLRIDVLLDVGADVTVESPSHSIAALREEGGRVRVRFVREEVALDRDVILVARGRVEGEPLISVAAHRSGEGPGCFALTLVPDLFDGEADQEGRDIVFVIDTSGSMMGSSLTEAKAALHLCLRHLRAGDRFNIIEFNSVHRAFAPGPIPFDQNALEAADRWVARLQATGGTEMLRPLVKALRSAPDGIVVLLTDGQVGNEDEILGAVLKARGRAQVHCLGIGTNVSDALLLGLARRTGGAVEWIHPGERVDEKVLSLFARALAPRIEDVGITFQGVEVSDLAPEQPGPLVDGEPFTIFGRYERPGRGRAVIRGRWRGQPFEREVPLDLPEREERPALVRLWAAERLRDLEGASLTGRRAKAMRERIVRLAVEHGLASRYTSFVVVEKREGDRRARGQPETRVIPVHLPAGWEMFQSGPMYRRGWTGMIPFGLMGAAGMPAPPPAPLPAAAPPNSRSAAPPAGRPGPAADDHEFDGPLMVLSDVGLDDGAPPPAADAGEAPGGDPAMRLLARQLASGLWDEPGAEGDDEARRLRATARALLELRDLGIDAAHSLYGELVRKAIRAVVGLAPRVAARDPQAAERALGAAWLASGGRRIRREVEAAISACEALADLHRRLGDPAEVQRRIDAIPA